MSAEAIVRLLAETDEPIDSEWGQCLVCGSYAGHDNRSVHSEGCAWVLARAWFADSANVPDRIDSGQKEFRLP